MKARLVVLLICIPCFLALPARAMFMRPDLEKVPIDRLVKNLEEIADKEPKNYQIRYNLARVHAMAYALKVEMCDTNKKSPTGGAWFGFTPPVVPFAKTVATEDKAKVELAKKHLEKAIATYKATLKVQEDYLPAMLGLAWCIEQSGDKDEAIKAYRTVVTKGWEKESKLKGGPLGGNFITKEAAGYLIPLLDATKDAEEIGILKDRTAQLNKLPRPITPIAIPLRDGLTWRDLEDRNATVTFDADGMGPRKWSWITKDAGWLVHDPKNTGKITSGLQLFGNVSFWCFWANGYEAMRSLDDNRDGILRGKELDGLAIWHDANGDGICDPGEVRPLSYYGIVGLSCEWQTDPTHPDRIAFSPRGVIFRDGTTRPSFDFILRSK